ncbi:MAG: TIGR00730 family Rossman fold protein [Verrucomicrobiota bacterium]
MKRVCVQCGSNPGFAPVYLEAARELGRVLGRQRLELVYGGAAVGLMGAVADEALTAGARVIGIIPESFAHRIAHLRLTELHVVPGMHERKAMMFERSDGFVALPGGYGTLDEVFEVLTWAQLGFHQKPCGLLNVNGYFNRLIGFLDHAAAEGFLKPAHREMLLVEDTPAALLERLAGYHPPQVDKWMEKTRM